VENTTGHGIGLIADARAKQLLKGRSREHDQHHVDGELLDAAQVYLGAARRQVLGTWPWPDQDAFPAAGDSRIKLLAHAAALIAAEIDRALANGEQP
jgi:hypothetical protein